MEFYAFSGHHRNKEPCDTCPGRPRMRLMYTEEVKNFFFWTCAPCPDGWPVSKQITWLEPPKEAQYILFEEASEEVVAEVIKELEQQKTLFDKPASDYHGETLDLF